MSSDQQQVPDWNQSICNSITSMALQVVNQTAQPFSLHCAMSKDGFFFLTMTNGEKIISMPGKVELSPIVRAAVAPPVNGHTSRFRLAQPDEN